MLSKDILTKPVTFFFYQQPLFRRMISWLLLLIKTQQKLHLTLCAYFLHYVQKLKMQTNNGAQYFRQKYEAYEIRINKTKTNNAKYSKGQYFRVEHTVLMQSKWH